MIKLIATDMDGTFLNSQKTFDIAFIDTYTKMKAHGIYFVIASGNQYKRLFQKFLPMSPDMLFIAENGSYIAKGTQELYCNTIQPSNVKKILQILDNYPQLAIIFCSKECAYIKNENRYLEDLIRLHYCDFKFVDRFDELIDNQIIKFSIYDPKENIETYLKDIQADLPEEIKVVTSGNMWMDIQNRNINKGIAMKILQDLYHISPDECMAFGDQMNDYELIKSVKYGYAMENAVDAIKDIAYDVCLDNEQQGVIKKINAYLETL